MVVCCICRCTVALSHKCGCGGVCRGCAVLLGGRCLACSQPIVKQAVLAGAAVAGIRFAYCSVCGMDVAPSLFDTRCPHSVVGLRGPQPSVPAQTVLQIVRPDVMARVPLDGTPVAVVHPGNIVVLLSDGAGTVTAHANLEIHHDGATRVMLAGEQLHNVTGHLTISSVPATAMRSVCEVLRTWPKHAAAVPLLAPPRRQIAPTGFVPLHNLDPNLYANRTPARKCCATTRFRCEHNPDVQLFCGMCGTLYNSGSVCGSL